LFILLHGYLNSKVIDITPLTFIIS